MNDIQFLYYEKKNISNVKLYQIFILVYFPTNEREGKYLKLLYTTCFVSIESFILVCTLYNNSRCREYAELGKTCSKN